MDKPIEDKLYQAVILENQVTMFQCLSQGANPNKTASCGKTCLGEACNMGNSEIVKLLIQYSCIKNTDSPLRQGVNIKSHKRKLRPEGECDETVVKYKNRYDRTYKDFYLDRKTPEKPMQNQGYYVVIHNDGSSSDESKIPALRSLTPLTPSPQEELEWDEEIGDIAPTTSEDESWSSMYKWYAAILERTGAAIASASMVTFGIDQQDAFTRTALHYAAEQGHQDIVKLLLDAGCKLDIAAGNGMTPLHVAVIRNNMEIVRMLINAGSQVNYKNYEKMTPLHFAASRGFLSIVSILVRHGSDLEARDTSEHTALYLAACRGHVDVVKCLIASGANVNCEEIHGYTPLCEAVWQRFPSVVEALLSSSARITHSHRLLHNAIMQQQVPTEMESSRCEIVKMLACVGGGGINLHNDHGDTPLLLATRLSQPALVHMLLVNGANVNSFNSITGATALHIAVESVESYDEFKKLLICLLNYNIDMNATALTGDTALNRALLLNKDHAAVLLIRYGADVNSCDLHLCGLDNLSIASRRKSCNLACMLLKAGHYMPFKDPSIPAPKSGTTENWLLCITKEPLCLSDLCRINIRYMAQGKLHSFIDSLPLPKSLKRFLMMEDEGV